MEEAAGAVKALIRDPHRRDVMGRNARERARTFLMSKLMRELLNRARSIHHMNNPSPVYLEIKEGIKAKSSSSQADYLQPVRKPWVGSYGKDKV